MAWRDNLYTASFRGVPFLVDEGGMEGGRRTVTHEFPLRDKPFVEDMGRKARTFTVDAYVIGDDYFAKRDALITALEAGGNGSLVHHYLGTKQVKVPSFTLRENKSEGRMARFSITFAESEEAQSFPDVGLDKLGLVNSAADNALSNFASSFLGNYSVALQPQFAINSLVGIIQDGMGLLEQLFGNKKVTPQVQAVIRSAIDTVYTNAPTLARSPQGIIDGVQDTISLLAQNLAPNDAADVMVQAYTLQSGADPAVATSTRILEKSNRAALFALFRSSTATEAARAAVQATYASYDDAITARDKIAAMLDEQAAVASDNSYFALDRLRKEVVRALPGEQNALPRIAEFTTKETMPSLALAHYIYGTVDNEADLVARNKVRHPGFVTGNRKIEVLTA